MNRLIIRVCEIALAALTEVQMQAKQRMDESIADMTDRNKPDVVWSAEAINQEQYEYERRYNRAEEHKKEVVALLNIAYKKDI